MSRELIERLTAAITEMDRCYCEVTYPPLSPDQRADHRKALIAARQVIAEARAALANPDATIPA